MHPPHAFNAAIVCCIWKLSCLGSLSWITAGHDGSGVVNLCAWDAKFERLQNCEAWKLHPYLVIRTSLIPTSD